MINESSLQTPVAKNRK